MYPIPAVLIHCSDHTSSVVRAVLLDNAVAVTDSFKQVEDVLTRWPTPPPGHRMFLIRIQGLRAVEMTRKLSDQFPGWPILALIDGDPDPAGLYQLSRAGAAQLVPFPFTTDDFQLALDRILCQFGLRAAPSRLVTVTGASPGAGATFLSVNLAAELADGYAVDTILTELEYGVGRLAGQLDLSPPLCTRDLLARPQPLTTAHVQTGLVTLSNQLRVLVGPYRSVEAEPPPPGRSAELLRSLKRLASITIVDVPVSFTEPFFEYLALADRILLVSRADVPSIQSLKLVRELLTNRGLLEPQLILNGYIGETSAIRPERVAELLNISTPIVVRADSTAARRCADTGTTLRATTPRSPVRQDIASIAGNLVREFGLASDPYREPVPRSWLGRLFE